MSIISAVRTYLLAFDGLEDNAPLLTDVLGNKATQYAIVPVPVAPIVEEYLDGSSLRQFAFALQSLNEIDSQEAINAAHEFYEAFAEWLYEQNDASALPILGTGKTAESIEALQSGFLLDAGESGTGIYQIQCRLTYQQDAP